MPEDTTTPERALAALNDRGARLPGVTEGIACAGTALERRTLNVGKKAFLFLGEGDARLKLGGSIPQAEALASRQPDRCEVGIHGWIKLMFKGDLAIDAETLAAWAEESYRLMAPKRLVKQLDEAGS